MRKNNYYVIRDTIIISSLIVAIQWYLGSLHQKLEIIILFYKLLTLLNFALTFYNIVYITNICILIYIIK